MALAVVGKYKRAINTSNTLGAQAVLGGDAVKVNKVIFIP
jgi:hypothetical protein